MITSTFAFPYDEGLASLVELAFATTPTMNTRSTSLYGERSMPSPLLSGRIISYHIQERKTTRLPTMLSMLPCGFSSVCFPFTSSLRHCKIALPFEAILCLPVLLIAFFLTSQRKKKDIYFHE